MDTLTQLSQPMVAIGGQTMTQAQFDAARFPLLADNPEDTVCEHAPDDPETCERDSRNLPDAEADGYSWGPALYRAHLLSTHGQIGRALSAAEPPPNRHAIRTAHLWTALLSDKLAEGEFLTVGDVRRLREAERLSADVGENQ